ncbi:hypothetical protein EYC84_004912 [Monilinia fructicola]|uniref:SH3 domain-containing protein n=1 Tax=Monilinia fructicola TaxID=38448 RepID=A0A5M9K2Q3_MONFR|nr:hypothetical protein EYC84_004912 [Monilinia fructicola]
MAAVISQRRRQQRLHHQIGYHNTPIIPRPHDRGHLHTSSPSFIPASRTRRSAISHTLRCILCTMGPPPEPSQPPSGLSTPASESHKRLSDPPTSWDNRGSWGPGPWGGDGFMKGEQLAPIHFGDGPPWSEDEDLQSPVVVSSRHRKHKSSAGEYGDISRGRGRAPRDGERRTSMLSQENFDDDRGYFAGPSGDSSERYYVNEGDEPDGPGANIRSYTDESGQDYRSESDASSTVSSPGMTRHDESRYSRDYQFTIASPDEEMHGTAVALFDFERENENELPLVEGQVIWVSYRHGQGWLVAEDPKTQESGLVPEDLLAPVGGDSGTPTQAEHSQAFGHNPSSSNGSNGYQQPVVSTFSTSSKDLHLYPQHLLGTQAGQAPPQIIHYHGQRGGSQANTPTIPSSLEGLIDRPSSQDAQNGKSEDTSSNQERPVESAQTESQPKLTSSITVQNSGSPLGPSGDAASETHENPTQ